MSAIPSESWRVLAEPLQRQPLPKGLDAGWAWLVGQAPRFVPRRMQLARRASRIVALGNALTQIPEAQLQQQALELREHFRRGTETQTDIDRALAVIRELGQRSLGMRAYRVQVMGALGLETGVLVEMATGEGKTLVAALAGVLAGWRGKGCHVVTVNDYLAHRDAEWMKPLYDSCGVRVASIVADTGSEERKGAYAADVTYATNKEIAADFLRDLLTIEEQGGRGLARALVHGRADGKSTLQRGLVSAIVDEADSVLIDEAVTPLILSQSPDDGDGDSKYTQADELASSMGMDRHFTVDLTHREIHLTREGQRLVESPERSGFASTPREREELVVQALSAQYLFFRDQHYVIKDEQVVIVDEFTGRLMPDRQWRGGLHQAVQAKEKLDIHEATDTLARISFQRFFGLYPKLSGMTGTAHEARGELWHVYKLPVVKTPTNRPVRRMCRPDRIFADLAGKWDAVLKEIQDVHQSGRPVLVGTHSVSDSEHLSTLLTHDGITHQVLNAIRHEEEAQIIANAGEPGRVTVATNMAGRGTDIKLGAGVAEMGGLHVIATERHESARVDRQLFGRSGRQGDPGSAVAYVSIDDDLMVRHGRGMLCRVARSAGFQRLAFRLAQQRAQRIAQRQRVGVLKADDWLDDALGFAGRSV